MLKNVKCPIDKIQSLILQEYPRFYSRTKEEKIEIVKDFVSEEDVQIVYKYMEA
ncbi:MAG: hypothetical protein PHT02_00865 [Tissierellia bacterium]|nr:hypothetical protein [Tissierellia bacterium]